jgi:hypothetical protein
VIGPLPALLAMVAAAAGDAAPAGGGAKVPTAIPSTPQPPAAPAPQPPEELPIAIVWSAPAECPTIEALKAEILRVAGQVPPPSEPLSATVTVQRGAAGWQLTLATAAGARAGERRLAGPDCGELMRAAALVLALMINPQASLLAEPPPPPPPPPAPPPPPPEPERRFAVGADLLVGSGALPGFATGFGLHVAAGAALSAELRASLWLSRSAATTEDPGAGGTFDLMDASAAGCARRGHGQPLSPGLCAGASIVRLHGTGYGVGFPSEASAWWTSAFAEANLRVGISALNAVRLAAGVAVPLGRPNFVLAGVGQVFEPASIWLRATLGWELHF